ncbi:MAG: acetate--CoA ligase [Chloroflexi bacterium]|nr:acetate--CoA ligase [Chloroflexota bacterium]
MSTTSSGTFAAMRAEALADPAAFWGRVAGDLPWFRRWDRVYVPDPPSFRWFVGGRTNLAFSALDHHVTAGHGERVALIAVDERGGDRRLTYAELLADVERTAAGLRAIGIGRGDRLTIYLPTITEAVVAMLATVRIGAIHSVVFAGFGHGALADRIVASGSRAVLTSDITYRKGNDVALLPIVRDAVTQANAEMPGLVERVVVLRRADPVPQLRGIELDWEAMLEGGRGHSGAHEEMEANEPAYILATSGTTAKPKLAVHMHGGYQVHIVAMGRWVFGMRREDVFWATADIGWAVGHAYTVYAPLIIGCTSVAYEGALDYPANDAAWALMDRLGVTGVFTSPTAVRLLMRYGEAGAKAHDLSRLERIVCAGEVLNPPAWEWLQKTVFNDRVPVIDNMWQTETGGPIFGNPYGVELMPIKPGSAGIPLPGIEAAIVTMDGTELGPNEKGIMVIRRPFPGLTPTLWGEPGRYASDYWGRIPGSYWVGDAAHIDEDGYAFFAGRADEIIKIAAHRLGTIEVETAFLRHPAVAEAGATGRPDDLRGEVIAAFIVLKAGREPSDELAAELRRTLRNELGALAVLGELSFVDMLPKTRSGKIMRRVLKAVVEGRDPGDITTIEDEGSVEEARQAVEELRAAIRSEREVGPPLKPRG